MRTARISFMCGLDIHNWRILRVLDDGITTDSVCKNCGEFEYNIEPGEDYIGFSDREWNMVSMIPHRMFRPWPVYIREFTKIRPGDIVVYPKTGQIGIVVDSKPAIVSVNLGTYTERVKLLYGRDV